MKQSRLRKTAPVSRHCLIIFLGLACLAAGRVFFQGDPAPRERLHGAGKLPEAVTYRVPSRQENVLRFAALVPDPGGSGTGAGNPPIGHVSHPTAPQPASDANGVLSDLRDQAIGETEQHADPEVRAQAIHTLVQAIDELSLLAIEAALLDPEPDVREAAIDALGDIGGGRASFALQVVMYDVEPELREEAVHTLADIGDVYARETIALALLDDHPQVRRAAQAALHRIPPVAAQSAAGRTP